MLLTPEQLQEIRRIILDYHSAFVVNVIGPTAVAPEILARLKAKGLVDIRIQSIQDAYAYGQLLAHLDNPAIARMTYTQFRDYIRRHPVPMTPVERQAVKMAEASAGQYCAGLGNRVDVATGATLIEADATLRNQLKDVIRTETAEAIARRESVQKLASNLGHATQDWARDWRRIANTEVQQAMQTGLADRYREDHGTDVRVAKVPMPDACEHCKRLFLGSDGKPYIWRLTDLQAFGTNVGRKTRDWVPTVGTVHPHCQCQLIRIPKGFGFDAAGRLVPGGRLGVEADADDFMRSLQLEDEFHKSLSSNDLVNFQGIPVHIENRAGELRHWESATGERGTTHMLCAYGEVVGTDGADGDGIDVYVGPDPKANTVYVVHQQNPETGVYDEEKAMLGFPSEEFALQVYRAHFNKPGFDVAVSPMGVEQFRVWADATIAGRGEGKSETLRLVIPLEKAQAGPYIGPRGGKWADPEMTVPWKEGQGQTKAPTTQEVHQVKEPLSGKQIPATWSAMLDAAMGERGRGGGSKGFVRPTPSHWSHLSMILEANRGLDKTPAGAAMVRAAEEASVRLDLSPWIKKDPRDITQEDIDAAFANPPWTKQAEAQPQGKAQQQELPTKSAESSPPPPKSVGREVREDPEPEWATGKGPWRAERYSFGENPEAKPLAEISMADLPKDWLDGSSYDMRDAVKAKFGELKVPPGYQLVFRAGSGAKAGLANRNAGNLEGMISFIRHYEDKGIEYGNKITAYAVRMPEEFAEYEKRKGAYLKKAQPQMGPFIGPRGGKWADPELTIPWKARKGRQPAAPAESEQRPRAMPAEEPKTAQMQALLEEIRKPGLRRWKMLSSPDYQGPVQFSMSQDEAEGAIASEPLEHAVAFGSKGTQLFRASSNERKFVAFDPSQIAEMRIDGGAVLTHNHPSGSCFSVDDIALMLVSNMKEMRAVAPDGTTYILTRPEDGWTQKHADGLVSECSMAAQDAFRAATRRMDAIILAAGGIPGTTGAKGYSDEVWHEIFRQEHEATLATAFERFGVKFRKAKAAPGAAKDRGRGDRAGQEPSGAGVRQEYHRPEQLRLLDAAERAYRQFKQKRRGVSEQLELYGTSTADVLKYEPALTSAQKAMPKSAALKAIEQKPLDSPAEWKLPAGARINDPWEPDPVPPDAKWSHPDYGEGVGAAPWQQSENWHPDLASYDYIVINSSGGKDSQCMLTHLVNLAEQNNIPMDKLVVVHCDLGRAEWAKTRELAEQQAKHYGLRFEVVKRRQNDLVQHIEARHGDLVQRHEDGKKLKAAGIETWKDLSEASVEKIREVIGDEKGASQWEGLNRARKLKNKAKKEAASPKKGPGAPIDFGKVVAWPSMGSRYCTSEHKRAEVDKLLTKLVHEHQAKTGVKKPVRLLNSLGIRMQEGEKREKLPTFARDETTGTRTTDQWYPIHRWHEKKVWDTIAKSGVPHHNAYNLGMRRLSCVFCVLAGKEDIMIAAKHNPDLFKTYLELEEKVGTSFNSSYSLSEVRDEIQKRRDEGYDLNELAQWVKKALGLRVGDTLVKAALEEDAEGHSTALVPLVLGAALDRIEAKKETVTTVTVDWKPRGVCIHLDTEAHSHHVLYLPYPDAYDASLLAVSFAGKNNLDFEENNSPPPLRREPLAKSDDPGIVAIVAASQSMAGARNPGRGTAPNFLFNTPIREPAKTDPRVFQEMIADEQRDEDMEAARRRRRRDRRIYNVTKPIPDHIFVLEPPLEWRAYEKIRDGKHRQRQAKLKKFERDNTGLLNEDHVFIRKSEDDPEGQ